MSIFNSINTNRQAVFALQSLNQNNAELNAVQKRVSTGFRVSDSQDDSGAFSVAQTVRSDMAGVTAVNEQLGGTRGILATTLTALTQVSNTMQQLRTTATRLADGAITADSRTQYEGQYRDLVGQIRSFVADATYNGRSLLVTQGTLNIGAGGSINGGNITGLRNEAGNEYTINATDGAALIVGGAGITGTAAISVPTSAADAQALIQGGIATSGTGANFASVEARINSALGRFGSSAAIVDNQINYNSKRLDALADGLGALVDADLAKESARMKGLETRQQLSLQTLSMANQTPQSLLSLFR